LAQCRVKVAETLMMFDRLDHVLHPIACTTGCRFECFGKRRVFAKGNGLCLHGPLMTGVIAVTAEVDEHPELGFVPPAHAADLVRRRGGQEKHLDRLVTVFVRRPVTPASDARAAPLPTNLFLRPILNGFIFYFQL